ncbi:MAG: DUF4202 family protein [bacterium]
MLLDFLTNIEKEIEQIIQKSNLPEDFQHAHNTRIWILKLKPDANWALQLAALAHDIERAIPQRKITRSEYEDFNAFKRAHALNSARIVGEILEKYPLSDTIKSRIKYLIELHEFGRDGDPELLVLKDADSLSFFEVNLPLYFQRNSEQETLFRMRWGYARLSNQAKKFVKKMSYKNDRLNKLLRICIESKQESSNPLGVKANYSNK